MSRIHFEEVTGILLFIAWLVMFVIGIIKDDIYIIAFSAFILGVSAVNFLRYVQMVIQALRHK